MDVSKSKRLLIKIGAFYWALILLIYVIGWKQFHYLTSTTRLITESDTVGEITDGIVISQEYEVNSDTLESVQVLFSTYGRTNSGELHIQLLDSDYHVLAEKNIDNSQIVDKVYRKIPFDNVVIPDNKKIIINISSTNTSEGNAVTIYKGYSDYSADTSLSNPYFQINGQQENGSLCLRIESEKVIPAYRYFWALCVSVFILFAVYAKISLKKAENGINSYLAAFCTLFTKYQFLVKQLVNRDFKTKYKRSVLGVAWSFLNPLLTMLVQYFVFSKLFTSNIENYSVYLLVGVVFMNFFSEATSLGMNSITGNASLIKKVYMPKYIYPICRVLSSLINFLFSMIPLFLVMIITKTGFHLSLFLLLFDVICMVCFITGMVLILSTAMTFFQDTQFLWNVLSMMWMYLTPVFYPESIIPDQFLRIYHLNPMYQYVTFARICVIDGISPQPVNYLMCLLSSTLVLFLGIACFKKQQDKFILYI